FDFQCHLFHHLALREGVDDPARVLDVQAAPTLSGRVLVPDKVLHVATLWPLVVLVVVAAVLVRLAVANFAALNAEADGYRRDVLRVARAARELDAGVTDRVRLDVDEIVLVAALRAVDDRVRYDHRRRIPPN